jgi:hypothetical protein
MAKSEGVDASGHDVEFPSSDVLFFEFDKAEGVERECVWVNFVIQMDAVERDGDGCSARNRRAIGEGVVFNGNSLHRD